MSDRLEAALGRRPRAPGLNRDSSLLHDVGENGLDDFLSSSSDSESEGSQADADWAEELAKRVFEGTAALRQSSGREQEEREEREQEERAAEARRAAERLAAEQLLATAHLPGRTPPAPAPAPAPAAPTEDRRPVAERLSAMLPPPPPVVQRESSLLGALGDLEEDDDDDNAEQAQDDAWLADLGRRMLGQALISGHGDADQGAPPYVSLWRCGEGGEFAVTRDGERFLVGDCVVTMEPPSAYLAAAADFARASGHDEGARIQVDGVEDQTVLDVLSALRSWRGLLPALDYDPVGAIQAALALEVPQVLEEALAHPESALMLLRAAMLAGHANLKQLAMDAVAENEAPTGTRAWELAPRSLQVLAASNDVMPGAVL